MTNRPTFISRGSLAALAFLTALAGVAMLAGPGHAQRENCRDPRSQSEMNICSARTFEKVDRELNAVYRRVIARMVRDGGDPPYDAESWEQAMRAAQRAWVAFRDADCQGLVGRDWIGGSGAALAINGCMIDLTRRRIAVLKERYGER